MSVIENKRITNMANGILIKLNEFEKSIENIEKFKVEDIEPYLGKIVSLKSECKYAIIAVKSLEIDEYIEEYKLKNMLKQLYSRINDIEKRISRLIKRKNILLISLLKYEEMYNESIESINKSIELLEKDIKDMKDDNEFGVGYDPVEDLEYYKDEKQIGEMQLKKIKESIETVKNGGMVEDIWGEQIEEKEQENEKEEISVINEESISDKKIQASKTLSNLNDSYDLNHKAEINEPVTVSIKSIKDSINEYGKDSSNIKLDKISSIDNVNYSLIYGDYTKIRKCIDKYVSNYGEMPTAIEVASILDLPENEVEIAINEYNKNKGMKL